MEHGFSRTTSLTSLTSLNSLTSLPSLDAEYCFGRPKAYLAPHELARLAILRSRLGDTSAERAARAAGLVGGTTSDR